MPRPTAHPVSRTQHARPAHDRRAPDSRRFPQTCRNRARPVRSARLVAWSPRERVLGRGVTRCRNARTRCVALRSNFAPTRTVTPRHIPPTASRQAHESDTYRIPDYHDSGRPAAAPPVTGTASCSQRTGRRLIVASWGPGLGSTSVHQRGWIRDDADVKPSDAPYYRRDLALVHHLGFGFHADLVAPGILKPLEPIRARNGLVVELGCGSGLLTRHLLDAVGGRRDEDDGVGLPVEDGGRVARHEVDGADLTAEGVGVEGRRGVRTGRCPRRSRPRRRGHRASSRPAMRRASIPRRRQATESDPTPAKPASGGLCAGLNDAHGDIRPLLSVRISQPPKWTRGRGGCRRAGPWLVGASAAAPARQVPPRPHRHTRTRATNCCPDSISTVPRTGAIDRSAAATERASRTCQPGSRISQPWEKTQRESFPPDLAADPDGCEQLFLRQVRAAVAARVASDDSVILHALATCLVPVTTV
jgi:hypothetical protein